MKAKEKQSSKLGLPASAVVYLKAFLFYAVQSEMSLVVIIRNVCVYIYIFDYSY